MFLNHWLTKKTGQLVKTGTFLLLGMFLTASFCAADIVIDFANTNGYGLSNDRVMIENIRVDNEVVNPFDPTHPEIITSTYNVPFVFDYSNLHLVPDLGGAAVVDGSGASTCNGNVTVYVTNAYNGDPIPGAIVQLSGQQVNADSTGAAVLNVAAAGSGNIQVSAPGYVSSQRNATLSCDDSNSIGISMSPESGDGALAANEVRIVLSWGENPRDLDSHLTGPDSANSGDIAGDDSNRFHVYYSNRTSDVAVLDTDDTSSYGPETVTISPADSSSNLRQGLYRYSVHHYAGSSDISNSNASVTLFMAGTSRTYTPPAGSPGVDAVWTVFELYVDESGQVTVYDINTYTADVGSGSVRSTATGYGSVETGVDFARLPSK